MTIKTIYLGYWYQRTTLHLSEIYDFLKYGTSPLDLNKHKLKELQDKLDIESIELKMDVFEYIHCTAAHGITIKVYEDGLIVLAKDHIDIKKDSTVLTSYFEEQFTPAISYIFSLGAPVPRELAGVKSTPSLFVVTQGATKDSVSNLLTELDEARYFEIKSEGVDFYRGHRYSIVNVTASFKETEHLIEMQIFFKEFKSQLHHYLNLHRTIWEKIAEIKEQKSIKGKQVTQLRNELESYKKTVELIEGRLNQMGLYIGSRENRIKMLGLEQTLNDILQFRYENLKETLSYVKSIWTMTKQYIDSAIQLFNEVNTLATRNSITALTVITTLGVVNMLISLSGTKELPQLTSTGLYYLFLLVLLTWVINKIVTLVFRFARYKLTDIEYKKGLK